MQEAIPSYLLAPLVINARSVELVNIFTRCFPFENYENHHRFRSVANAVLPQL